MATIKELKFAINLDYAYYVDSIVYIKKHMESPKKPIKEYNELPF